LDFGIVRVAQTAPRGEAVPSDAGAGAAPGLDTSQSRLSTQLTQAGTIVGTPRFMSPEQHLGEAVDERGDQFSCCLTLYDALYGEWPFGGETLAELRRHVLSGRVSEPPAGARVARWLRQGVVKGPAVHPAGRAPAM